jgi:hypothetical protein
MAIADECKIYGPHLSAPQWTEQSEPRHIGKIRISEKTLLDWLQFDGGAIRGIQLSDFIASDTIEILIEHPEMPIVREGELVPEVWPLYSASYEAGRLTDIKRIPLR